MSASFRNHPAFRPAHSAAELTRCVEELGFIGCNLNPDPLRRPLEFAPSHRPSASRHFSDGERGARKERPCVLEYSYRLRCSSACARFFCASSNQTAEALIALPKYSRAAL